MLIKKKKLKKYLLTRIKNKIEISLKIKKYLQNIKNKVNLFSDLKMKKKIKFKNLTNQ